MTLEPTRLPGRSVSIEIFSLIGALLTMISLSTILLSGSPSSVVAGLGGLTSDCGAIVFGAGRVTADRGDWKEVGEASGKKCAGDGEDC